MQKEKSVKISEDTYKIVKRIAKKTRRSIKATIELAFQGK